MTNPSSSAALRPVEFQPTLPSVADAKTREKIHQTAKSFEGAFLSTVITSMFEGVTPSEPFSGGAGEQAFRSFLNDAMAKQMVTHGGIGLAQPIEKEMLRMQGLPQLPVAALTSAAALNNQSSVSANKLRDTAYGRYVQ